MSLSVLDPFVTYVVSLETLCLHYVSLVDHIIDSPSKSQTIKQGGKNKHNITRYDTNVKCVLILDMVPTGTEICLEVEIPYVGPNDGER